ncbi:MAG: patatin [Calditrichaeota bacterium]|nr:MAG: patatin [Calditrichota bacterium]
MNSLNDLKIGLALSGGATRGMAHLGALKALTENGIFPNAVAGTSIGALVATLYAFQVPLTTMYEHAKELNWLKVSNFTLSRTGLLTNKPIGELIEELIGDVNIEDAPIPLAIVTTDIATGEKVVLREGNAALAVMASTCVPGIFQPIELEGRLLVDGFILENVPITPLMDIQCDMIVAVNLSARKKYRVPDGLLDIVLNALDIAVDANMQKHLPGADILIEPDLFTIMEQEEIEEPYQAFYDEGFHTTMMRIKEIQMLINRYQRKKEPKLWRRFKRFFSPSTP